MQFMKAKGFYSFDSSDLLSQIEQYFMDKRYGPGYIPKNIKKEKNIISGIVPHARYEYFLPVSIKLYKELYENFDFDTIIIIGPNHYNIGQKINLIIDDWYTPFGIIKTDVEFARKILNNYDSYENPMLSRYEYSIEIQLPILRFLFKDKVKIVPIIVKEVELEMIKDFVKLLKELSKELNRKIILISTGNLYHHGEFYGNIIYKEKISENVKKESEKIIEYILKLDSEKLYKLEIDSKIFCGKYPFLFFIEYTKLYKGKIELISHILSSEINNDEKNVVGYASLLSYKPLKK